MPGRSGAPFRLGSLILQPVSDGVLRLDPASIFREAPPEEWQPRVTTGDDGRIAVALTCLLVQAGERRILVDTGFGSRPDNPLVGHLGESLNEIGVSPGSIDTVIVSHPHGDHIGGAAIGSGQDARPTFAEAGYWLGRADWDHFSQPERISQGGLADKLLPLASAQRLNLADGEQDVAPGVRLLPLPGHTPGHQGVAFISGQQMAIYIGDAIHHPLQVEHPEWAPIFDVLPPLGRQTRQALIERARREQLLILSYHLPFPGTGVINGTSWDAVSPGS